MSTFLYQGDCREVLRGMPDRWVDLVWTDPPYNIGYKYDKYNDGISRNDHVDMLREVMMQCDRVLKPGGAVCFMAGDETVAETKILMDRRGWKMRNLVVNHYNFGVACTKKFSRSHAHVWYYVKPGGKFTWNGWAVAVKSLRQTKYNDPRANPDGKMPDDTFQVQRIAGTHKERLGWHPCQLAEGVVEPFIKACTNPGDIVLDPFAGSGTTMKVADRLGREAFGIELSETYCDGIIERIPSCKWGRQREREEIHAPAHDPIREAVRADGDGG